MVDTRVRVTFKYTDKYTKGRWNTQQGIYKSVEECIRMNGLGKDCDYYIVKVEKMSEINKDDN